MKHKHPHRLKKRVRGKKQTIRNLLGRPAFTLVEFMVVIAVISTMGTVAFTTVGSPSKYFTDAHDTTARGNARAIQNALEQSRLQTGELPDEGRIPFGKSNAMPICRFGAFPGNDNPPCIRLDEIIAPGGKILFAHDPREPRDTLLGSCIYIAYDSPQVEAVHLGKRIGEEVVDDTPCPESTFAMDTASSITSSAASPTLHSWSVNGPVYALARINNTVYVGGAFTMFDGQPRDHLAAINMATGEVTSWNPGANGDVLAIAGATNTNTPFYLAGAFTTVGSLPRNHFAAIDVNGSVFPWNPDADGTGRAIALDGNTAYIGGSFGTIASQTRLGIAKVDATSGALDTNWDAHLAAGAQVNALAVDADRLYAGGSFTAPLPLSNLIATDKTTGACAFCQDAPPNPNGAVSTLALHEGTLYVGGSFTQIAGESRSRAAAFNTLAPLSLPLLPWAPLPNGSILAIEPHNHTFLGGSFTQIGTHAQNGVAAVVNDFGTEILVWDPSVNGSVHALLKLNAGGSSTILLGGAFTTVGGQPQAYLAHVGIP